MSADWYENVPTSDPCYHPREARFMHANLFSGAEDEKCGICGAITSLGIAPDGDEVAVAHV